MSAVWTETDTAVVPNQEHCLVHDNCSDERADELQPFVLNTVALATIAIARQAWGIETMKPVRRVS